MKKIKFNFFVIGFLVGVVYVAACGSTTQSLADAIDQLFNNSSSGMTATNVQDAIDEVDGRVDTLEGSNLAALLIGSWSGSEFCNSCGSSNSGENSGITFTFSEDGTFTCDMGNAQNAGIDEVCDNPATWTVLNRVIKLSYTVTLTTGCTGTCTPTPSTTATRIAMLSVQHIDSDGLEIIDGVDDEGVSILSFSKSP